MTVIWGLDLNEIHWTKFKGSKMFTRIYHLRRTKMVVYQIAMIFCVCSESVGTAALSGTILLPVNCQVYTHTHTHTFAHPSYLSIIDYLDQQSQLQGQHPGVFIHNNDFIGAASYNIFAGISVAFIFGGAFFFDLFWPERHEDRGIRWAWKGCAVLESLIMLSSALAMTVCSPYKWASFLICVAHAVSI